MILIYYHEVNVRQLVNLDSQENEYYDNSRYFTELIWRCMMRKHLEKLLAIILGCMSVAILLAEATLLPSGLDLSLFSILINSVGKQEMLVQVASKFFFFFNMQKIWDILSGRSIDQFMSSLDYIHTNLNSLF